MKKAIEWMQKIQIAVGGFFLCIFLLTVVFQMLSRYIGIAATWTEDVSMYSFIWAVFMGAGAMVYEKRHFAFTSVNIPSFKRGPTWTCLPICGVTSAIYLIAQIIEEIGAITKGDNK